MMQYMASYVLLLLHIYNTKVHSKKSNLISQTCLNIQAVWNQIDLNFIYFIYIQNDLRITRDLDFNDDRFVHQFSFFNIYLYNKDLN